MANPLIGLYGNQITTILANNPDTAIQKLFEIYRISGSNQAAFVAALIGQLCVMNAQNRSTR